MPQATSSQAINTDTHTHAHTSTPHTQAMALMAYPPVLPTSLETLSLMVDDMWYCAGDKSTDANWYSKRALLAAVYTSTGM